MHFNNYRIVEKYNIINWKCSVEHSKFGYITFVKGGDP
jgi:hypothetical protein